jgi:hypothetical protein
VRLALDRVEREVARLWEQEARVCATPRIEALTLVALVSEPEQLARVERVLAEVVRSHPSRTIVAMWRGGEPPAITADVALHRAVPNGPACGDAIVLEAVGGAREWLPDNADRLALADLPVCVWWVGDLPDFDDLFDRMVVGADWVVVNSSEMDLRDLEKLSAIVARSRGRYALADLTWIRLRCLQDLVARFFDDEPAITHLEHLERITIEFADGSADGATAKARSRSGPEPDPLSTTAGLLFGWMAHVLGLRPADARWRREEHWSEASWGRIAARFERGPRVDVRPGAVLRIAMECGHGARFAIERQRDPQVFRWSREVPGAPLPAQLFRLPSLPESTLLVQSLERLRRDPLFERTLDAASRLVRPVARRAAARSGPAAP